MNFIRFISDLQKSSIERLDEQPVIITESACVGLSLYTNIEKSYVDTFEYLIRNCVGDKPDLISSWYESGQALENLAELERFEDIEDIMKDTPMGINLSNVWRNHELYGDQILSLIQNMLFNIDQRFTIYEFSASEDEESQSIDISTFEKVLKTDYTHIYINGNMINCFVSSESLTVEEYTFHHNMRQLLLRMITNIRGVKKLVLGDITFLIKNFQSSKFQNNNSVGIIHLSSPSLDLYKEIIQ